MEYEDIEPYLKTRQLLGWTETLWKNQSGELWSVAIKGCYGHCYGLCLVNSEFRKDDIKGQCPSLHKTEMMTIWDNEIKCTALAWYVYAHANPDSDIDDKKMLDIIKDYYGIIAADFYDNLVYIQNNYDDIEHLLYCLELTIQDFLRWMYRVYSELNNNFLNLANSYEQCKNHNDDEKSNECHKSNWFLNTLILFSPTSEGEHNCTMNGYPYTHILYNPLRISGMPPQMPGVEWVLLYSQAAENQKDASYKVVAKYMPAVLFVYVAEESRKKILGTEWEWSNDMIDFKSRDFTWAFHNKIDVSQLNFSIDGRKLYDAYLKDNFENAKKLFREKPGFELISDDMIWNAMYDIEIEHWQNDKPLKDILPKDVYSGYTKYMEAYFAYFRYIHPCVCEVDEALNDSSNPQTTQPVEKTEDEEQGMQVTHAENIANQPKTIDINGLGYYFKAPFKGIGQGNEVNKEKFEEFVQLLNHARSKKEAARIAYIIYQSDQLIRDKRRPANFNAWYKIFCQLTGYKYSVYRPAQLKITEKLKKEFYML